MTKQRNKFWTVVFSLVPGCGQMFMGFMKRGLSLLILFVLPLMFGDMLNISDLGFLSVIVWFYAFFDTINLRWSAPEAFAQVQDSWLLPAEKGAPAIPCVKVRRAAGVLLILVGAWALLNNAFWAVYNNLYTSMPALAERLYDIHRYVPRTVVGVLIVLLGIRLVRVKKAQTEQALPEQEDPLHE